MSAPPARKATARRARPWGDYALRVFCCALLFGAGYGLLLNSTFAFRLRGDVPGGVESIVLGLAAFLAFLPLLFGRRFLGALLTSSFLLAGIGAYWWTLIPWDELIHESDFVTQTPPDWWKYLQVAAPLVIAALYVTASRASRMRAEYRNRGADPDEVTHAAAASFLAGMGTLVVTLVLAGGLWGLLASGALTSMRSGLRGVPAIVVAAALLTLAWALGSGRIARGGPAWLRRPWQAAAGLAARARNRARKSPS